MNCDQYLVPKTQAESATRLEMLQRWNKFPEASPTLSSNPSVLYTAAVMFRRLVNLSPLPSRL